MTASATAPRFVHELARPQPGLAPTERVGVAAEWVRVSPYRCVPVLSGGVLLGLVTDASLTRYLLAAPEGPERRRWLEAPVEDTVLIPTAALSPLLSVEALLTALEDEGVDTLPVAEGSGIYLGMVGRSDLVRELLRPLALPQLGGMATPIGVHLSTGAVCAGAGHIALVTTGFCFFFVQLALVLLLGAALPSPLPLPLPPAWRETIELALIGFTTLGGFLGLIRLSPIAGFHAAEHQVVHALERHVPLLPELVGRLPRVHPRCGTNLLAGTFLLGLGGMLTPLLGESGYVLSGILALFFWRSLGAWFQEHLTTKPASRAQLAQAIHAAQTLLERHESATRPTTPWLRLLNSGMLHMLLGFAIGAALLWFLSLLIPSLGALLRQYV